MIDDDGGRVSSPRIRTLLVILFGRSHEVSSIVILRDEERWDVPREAAFARFMSASDF